ncbi:MAG: acyltransferase family protein [Breznakibacter sp.]
MKEETRDSYFDNLKAVLIFLVVLGHFTNLNRSIPLIGAINNAIYSFHMPLFIFISGYFSKSITSQRALEIENILYPYFVFQGINYFFTKMSGLGYGSVNIFEPTYQNWYLLGLLFWRILIPYYNLFNKKVSFFFTIILSFTIGFFDGFDTFLGLYRVIYFFPIFILGFYCSDLNLLINKKSKYKYFFISISSLGLFSIFLVSFYYSSLNDLISFAFTPYSNYNHSIINFYVRVIGFFSSLIISFGLLFIVPANKLKITHLGENTLNIFLLHMFLVYPINNYLVSISNYLLFLISIVSSVLICFLLSRSLVNKIFEPFTKLKQLKLLIRNNAKVRFLRGS